MNRKICLLLIASLGAATLPAQIQIGLDELAAKAKESVSISLDSSMLQMASSFLGSGKSQDERFRKLVSGLKAIHVKTFEFAQDGQYRPEDLQPIRKQLGAPGWSKIVDIKETRETTEIYTKTEQGKTVGFAILTAEPRELVVVYIEGAVDLAGLADLGGQFGIPRIPILGQKRLKGAQ